MRIECLFEICFILQRKSRKQGGTAVDSSLAVMTGCEGFFVRMSRGRDNHKINHSIKPTNHQIKINQKGKHYESKIR